MLNNVRAKMLDATITVVDYLRFKLSGQNVALLPPNVEVVSSLPEGAASFNLSASVQMPYNPENGKLSVCVTDTVLLGNKNSQNAASYLANAGIDTIKFTVAAIALVLYRRVMDADIDTVAKQETAADIDNGYVN